MEDFQKEVMNHLYPVIVLFTSSYILALKTHFINLVVQKRVISLRASLENTSIKATENIELFWSICLMLKELEML